MSTSMYVYSTDPTAFASLLTSDESWDELGALPSADFSLHLLWPDDFDLLLKAARAQGLPVSEFFDSLLAEELPTSDETTSAWRLVSTFASAFATYSDRDIDQVANRWYAPFEADLSANGGYESALNVGRAALYDLRRISQDALDSSNTRELIFFMAG